MHSTFKDIISIHDIELKKYVTTLVNTVRAVFALMTFLSRLASPPKPSHPPTAHRTHGHGRWRMK